MGWHVHVLQHNPLIVLSVVAAIFLDKAHSPQHAIANLDKIRAAWDVPVVAYMLLGSHVRWNFTLLHHNHLPIDDLQLSSGCVQNGNLVAQHVQVFLGLVQDVRVDAPSIGVEISVHDCQMAGEQIALRQITQNIPCHLLGIHLLVDFIGI